MPSRFSWLISCFLVNIVSPVTIAVWDCSVVSSTDPSAFGDKDLFPCKLGVVARLDACLAFFRCSSSAILLFINSISLSLDLKPSNSTLLLGVTGSGGVARAALRKCRLSSESLRSAIDGRFCCEFIGFIELRIEVPYRS